MMPPFEYARPGSVEEALGLLTPGAEPLAGGTDLLSLMKDGILAPKRLVSLVAIEDLRGVRRDEGTIRIGAGTTLAALASDPAVRLDLPALVHAIEGIKSPQIRATGTVGGDLCQRPRCWFYREGIAPLAGDDARARVLGGDHRHHAIFGTDGPALFVSASSLGPALLALDARIEIAARSGAREVPAASFFRVPKAATEREVSLAPGEIVTAVRVPIARGARSATYEVRAHDSLDWPLAAAAVSVDSDGGVVRTARVVLGHVAPAPWPAPAAERALQGKTLTEETARAAGRAAVADAKPLPGNAAKVRWAEVAVARALLRAAGKEVP